MGTATTRVATSSGPVISTPSLAGDHHAVTAGAVVDGEAAVAVLEPLLRQTRRFGLVRPRVVACAPGDVSRAERDLLVDSVLRAGASSVVIVPEPLAAAIGAGVDVASPFAHTVIDIGEGVTDCAIISSGRIVTTVTIRGGIARMRGAVIEKAWSLLGKVITENEAEEFIRRIGVARRDKLAAGEEMISAVEPVMKEMLGSISSFLQDAPHRLGSELIDSGIRLTGGGALIPGMRQRVEEQTGITVTFAPHPLEAVVEGVRAILPVVAATDMWRGSCDVSRGDR
ncbi:rod shape-determining protein [Geobacter sp. DSM 9736]|uniref:rod shape-determining protein n=1 Tax=Geobacter sp. DSM 9736 TaxID=1277350 RepID=UPI001E5F5F66|nr:rod shape-determining protein [Geobacter sp. DSM 9736]